MSRLHVSITCCEYSGVHESMLNVKYVPGGVPPPAIQPEEENVAAQVLIPQPPNSVPSVLVVEHCQPAFGHLEQTHCKL